MFDPFGRFTVVNAIIAKAAYHKWPGGELDPMRTRNQRMVGALAVAAPVRNIVPRGPVVAPWVAVGLSVVLLGGALAARRRAAKTGSAQ
ncbi:MAG: hypothetical protein HYZ00_06800 [Candidatus Hydrogenedentes bacterium]|nr:hypothetical protein [Candidatus Hydrogenedentota bacterium]